MKTSQNLPVTAPSQDFLSVKIESQDIHFENKSDLKEFITAELIKCDIKNFSVKVLNYKFLLAYVNFMRAEVRYFDIPKKSSNWYAFIFSLLNFLPSQFHLFIQAAKDFLEKCRKQNLYLISRLQLPNQTDSRETQNFVTLSNSSLKILSRIEVTLCIPVTKRAKLDPRNSNSKNIELINKIDCCYALLKSEKIVPILSSSYYQLSEQNCLLRPHLLMKNIAYLF